MLGLYNDLNVVLNPRTEYGAHAQELPMAWMNITLESTQPKEVKNRSREKFRVSFTLLIYASPDIFSERVISDFGAAVDLCWRVRDSFRRRRCRKPFTGTEDEVDE